MCALARAGVNERVGHVNPAGVDWKLEAKVMLIDLAPIKRRKRRGLDKMTEGGT